MLDEAWDMTVRASWTESGRNANNESLLSQNLRENDPVTWRSFTQLNVGDGVTNSDERSCSRMEGLCSSHNSNGRAAGEHFEISAPVIKLLLLVVIGGCDLGELKIKLRGMYVVFVRREIVCSFGA